MPVKPGQGVQAISVAAMTWAGEQDHEQPYLCSLPHISVGHVSVVLFSFLASALASEDLGLMNTCHTSDWNDNIQAKEVHAHGIFPRQETASLSPCVTDCFLSIFPNFHCSNVTQCVCENVPLQNALANCTIKSNCSIPDLLKSKKVQADMCGLPIRNRISVLVVTQSVLLGLTIPFVAARVVSRGQWAGGAGYGWDDWVLFATCIPMLGLTITGYMEQRAGLGQDVWELSTDQIKEVVELFYVGNTFYAPVVIGTKIAFVLLYIRIWQDSHTVFPRVCKAVVLLLVIALLGFEFSTIFLCEPVDYTWRSLTEHIEGQCINRDAQLYTNSSINIVFDFVVLLLPVSNVVKLGMGRPKKIGILSTFSVGFAVTATSFVQLYFLVKYVSKTENPTWDLFPIAVTRVVEIYLSIICCCMPMMAGLGKRFFRRLGDTISMHGSLHDGKWKNFGSSKDSKHGPKGASAHADSVLQLTSKPSAGGGNEEGDLRRGWQNENGSELEERETSASRSNSDENEDDPGDNKRHTRSGDEQRKAAESMLYGSARSEAQPFGENISPDQAQFFEDVTPVESKENLGREEHQHAPERRPRRSREDDNSKHQRTDTSSKAYTALPFVFGDGPALDLDDPSQKPRAQHHLLTAPGSSGGRNEDNGRAQKQNGPPQRQQDRHHILTPPDEEHAGEDVPEDEQVRRMASSVNTLRPPGHDKGRPQGDALPVPYSPSIYDSWDTTPASDFEGVSPPSASQDESTDDEEVAIPNDVKTLPSQGGRNLYDKYQRGVAADGGKSTDTPLAELGYGGTPYNKKNGYFSQRNSVANPKGWVPEPAKYAAGIKRLSAYDSPAYFGGPASPASGPPSPPLSLGGNTTRKMWHPDGTLDSERVTPPGSPRNLKPYEFGQIRLTSTPPPRSPASAPGMGNAADEEQRPAMTQGVPPSYAKSDGRKRNSSIASSDYPAHQYVRASDGTWDLARYSEPKSQPDRSDGRNDEPGYNRPSFPPGKGERDNAPVRPKAPTPAIPTAAEYMAQLLRSDSDHVPQWSPEEPVAPDQDAPTRRPAPAALQFVEFSQSRFEEANQRHPGREQAPLWQGGRTSGFEDHVQRRRVADAERQMEREQPVYPVTPPPDLPDEDQRKLDVALERTASVRGVYDNGDWDRADDWGNDYERYQQGDWRSNDRGWQELDDDFYRGRRWDGPVPPPSGDDYWSYRPYNQGCNDRRSRSVEISPEDHWHRGSIDHHRTSEVSPEDNWGTENGNRWLNRSVTTPVEDSFWHRRNVGGYGNPAETPVESRWRRRSSERYNHRDVETPIEDRWRRRSSDRYNYRRAETPVGDRWPPPSGERYRRRSVETPLVDDWHRRQDRRFSGGSWQEKFNRRYQPETPQFYKNPETPLFERFNGRYQPDTPQWKSQETPQHERFNGRYQPDTPLWKSQETPQYERFNGRYQPDTPQWKSQETPQYERFNGRYQSDTPQYRNNDEDEDDGYKPWRPSLALQNSLDEYTRKSMAEWKMTTDSFRPRRAKTTAVPTVNNVSNDQEDYLPASFKRSPSQHEGERRWKHEDFFVPPATQAEADKTSQGYVPRVLRSEKEPVSGWAALDQKSWSDNREDEQGEEKKWGNTETAEKSNAWAPVEVPR